jgi:hypothetical protein
LSGSGFRWFWTSESENEFETSGHVLFAFDALERKVNIRYFVAYQFARIPVASELDFHRGFFPFIGVRRLCQRLLWCKCHFVVGTDRAFRGAHSWSGRATVL